VYIFRPVPTNVISIYRIEREGEEGTYRVFERYRLLLLGSSLAGRTFLRTADGSEQQVSDEQEVSGGIRERKEM
jgi:hypothetical protein